MSIAGKHQDRYGIFYREVKSESDLQDDIKSDQSDVASISELLNDVRGNVDSEHGLDDLETNRYFRDWVETLLLKSESIGDGMDDEAERTLEYLAENFSKSMKSRARARGKYVVIILSPNSLIVCHSFTGTKALTTDMDVVEELLSVNNIDKFAEFKYNHEDEVVVQHFDRNDTQSFTDWLGIPEDEISFDMKGDIRIYTEIDGIDVVFEFDERAITEKLIASDDYTLTDGMLFTPNEQPRRIKKIRWGGVYTDVEEFKQDLFKTSHNLVRGFEMYDQHISDNIGSFFDTTDYERKVVKQKPDGVEEIEKPNVDFEMLFMNQYVEMDVAWRSELARKIHQNHGPIPIVHAGGELAGSAFPLGNFRIYNKLDLTDAQNKYIEDLMKTAKDMASDNLQPLFTHIVMELLSAFVSKPTNSVFRELSKEYVSMFRENVSEGTRVIQTEGEEADLEWKSPPWFDRQSSAEEIAEGLNREFQNSRFILLGITEDTKEFNSIESGVKSEKLIDIENTLREDHGLEDSHVWSIPIGDGHGLVAINIDENFGEITANLSILEDGN